MNRTHLRFLLIGGAATAAVGAFLVLLSCDIALMRWRYAVMPSELGGTLDQVIVGFRNFAQILSIVTAVCIVVAYDSRRKTIVVALLLAQVLSAAIYNAGKYTIARHRPYHVIEQVAPLAQLTSGQTWIGRATSDGNDHARSFPSGHSAAAFALAGVLVYFYRRLGWLFWILAFGCAVSRYLDAVHWPSDCFTGACVGYFAARLARAMALRWAPLKNLWRRSNLRDVPISIETQD